MGRFVERQGERERQKRELEMKKIGKILPVT